MTELCVMCSNVLPTECGSQVYRTCELADTIMDELQKKFVYCALYEGGIEE